MTYTVTIVNEEEENSEPVVVSGIEDESVEAIQDIIENGISECDKVCSAVDDMLSEAGIETDNHDEMLEVLDTLQLVKKDSE